MIEAPSPSRPLQGGRTAAGRPPAQWVRVYHREPGRIPDGTTPRSWGPVGRFDPRPGGHDGPREHPNGPTVHYSGDTLPVALTEAFRGAPVWSVCPAWRAALLIATTEALQDLGPDGAVALGPPADLGHRPDYTRASTQAWARAILADLPVGAVAGARYHSARQPDGENVVLWNRQPIAVLGALGAEDVALHDEAAWPWVLVAAHRLGASVERILITDCARHNGDA
ncbi:hypothetical protein BH23ACT8_BH23ACT8_21900 [soil metagenome]